VRTDDLIHLLSSDPVAAAPSLRSRLALWLLAGLAGSVLLFFWLYGPRDDLADPAAMPPILFKVAVMLLLAGAAAAVVLRLARPAARTRAVVPILLAPLLLLALGVAAALVLRPSGEWIEGLLGNDWRACLVGVVTLALPLLAVALLALRRGAPTRPALTGAVAGLLAGGLAAALYAVHCPDDSPLFVIAWYGAAIGLVSLLGALAGERLLRW
jgi:hypothetical protein